MGASPKTNKEEFRLLPSFMRTGEIAKCAIGGTYNGHAGLFVATDRRILFLNEHDLRSAKTETILYEDFSSLEWVSGKIWGGSITLHGREKSIKIEEVEADFIGHFAAYLETRIAGGDGDSLLADLRMPRLDAPRADDAATVPQSPRANLSPTPGGGNAKGSETTTGLRDPQHESQIEGCVLMGKHLIDKIELDLLPSFMQPGEIAKCAIAGDCNRTLSGLLVATDRRILFLKNKLFGSVESETILYETLTSVEWNRGITGAGITLHANRKSHKITNVEKDVVRDFATYLETRVMGGDADSVLARLRMPRISNSPRSQFYVRNPQTRSAPPQPASKDTAPPLSASENIAPPTQNAPISAGAFTRAATTQPAIGSGLPNDKGEGELDAVSPVRKWRWLAILCVPFAPYSLIAMLIAARKGKIDKTSWWLFIGGVAPFVVLGLASFMVDNEPSSTVRNNNAPAPSAATRSGSAAAPASSSDGMTPQLRNSLNSLYATTERMARHGITLTRWSQVCRWANVVSIDVAQSPNPSALAEHRDQANRVVRDCRERGIPINSGAWDAMSAYEKERLADRLAIPLR